MATASIFHESDFWNLVEIKGPDECWPWLGEQNIAGYGKIPWRKRERLAHRIAYELHHKIRLPSDHRGKGANCICHTCDNPRCVNPAHLWRGSRGDNNRDRALKGRGTQGEDHPMALLSASDIPAIRALAAGGEKFRIVGRKYGVSPATIYSIAYGVSWKHVKNNDHLILQKPEPKDSTKTTPPIEAVEDIRLRFKNGESCKTIGKSIGLTAAEVRMIATK